LLDLGVGLDHGDIDVHQQVEQAADDVDEIGRLRRCGQCRGLGEHRLRRPVHRLDQRRERETVLGMPLRHGGDESGDLGPAEGALLADRLEDGATAGVDGRQYLGGEMSLGQIRGGWDGAESCGEHSLGDPGPTGQQSRDQWGCAGCR
jgi:hypothetical protein